VSWRCAPPLALAGSISSDRFFVRACPLPHAAWRPGCSDPCCWHAPLLCRGGNQPGAGTGAGLLRILAGAPHRAAPTCAHALVHTILAQTAVDRGVFSADFHKDFRSTTRLLPKGADRNRLAVEDAAELEDPSFGAVFDTLTTDQVDVRYVLSPSLMERLTALAARFRGLRALFADGRLLLLLPTSRNRFEASLLERADDPRQIEAFIADAAACLGIVESLDLNTRIWSKS